MVDLHSRHRLYGCGFNYDPLRRAAKTTRDVHRIVASYTPMQLPVIAHDCRASYLQDFTHDPTWRAFVLSKALRLTAQSVDGLHKPPNIKVWPEKLLITSGIRGKNEGEFRYPRSLAINSTGDIYIADALNNRVQVYNSHGIYKFSIGNKLNLDEPSGIACFLNDDLALADRKNKRIFVLSSAGKEHFHFSTTDEPSSVVCDSRFNVIVSTYAGTVELYRRGGIFYNRFTPDGCKSPAALATNAKGEILVSNTENGSVQLYDHTGTKLYEFKLLSAYQGLRVGNTGIFVDKFNNIIVCDGLNHTVNLYTERGVLLHQYLGPTDDLGAVKSCAVGPEGHLAVTEYTSNGRHCLKIFRYFDCACHRYHKNDVSES